MSEKNISPQPAEPKKGQKNTRRYTRKPKQNKGTDALSQAVQSAIEFVKEPLSPRGKKAQAEEKKPQRKNNQKQAEKLERKNEGGAQQTQRRRRSSGKKTDGPHRPLRRLKRDRKKHDRLRVRQRYVHRRLRPGLPG